MHPISNCARPSDARRVNPRPWWIQAFWCLSCLVAGATLVALAVPTARLLSAGATVGQSVPQIGLLDFTATWCGPCQQMSPVVESLQRQGYPVYKVDVDQRPDLARQFRITGMPTFVLVVNGQEVMRQTGATSESQLRRMLLQIPEYQKIAAATEPSKSTATSRNDQFAAANPDPDFGPSPVAVDLGAAQAELPRSLAASEAPSRPKFGLPFFPRNRTAPEKAPVAPGEAVVRAQSDSLAASSGEVLLAQSPMQASTRLRVKEKTGIAYGSGTIIHSRPGRTLILTCGHIFREMDPSGAIEVDVFGRNNQSQTFAGRLLNFDLEADVGLVAIATADSLPAIPLASPNRPLVRGESLVSIGCGGGELPSRETVAVTAINKYDGPDTIECTGFPQLGRSGGGLYRGNELVGVCIAADPKDKRGVYTALAPIYELMEQAGYAQLLPVGQPAAAPAVAPPENAAAAEPVDSAVPASTSAATESLAAATIPAVATASVAGIDARAADDLQAAFAGSPDAEVICIVRPRDPRVPSRTIIIHQASPKLVGYLLDSVGPLTDPAAPTDALAHSQSLIPTAAQERPGADFPVELGAVSTSEAARRLSVEPTRPLSPRMR